MDKTLELLKDYLEKLYPSTAELDFYKVSETEDKKYVIVSFAEDGEPTIGNTLAVEESTLNVLPVMKFYALYSGKLPEIRTVYDASSDDIIAHGLISNFVSKVKSAAKSVATKTNSDGSWKKHKYVDRVQTKSGGWKYVYDQKKESAKKAVSNALYSVKRKASDAVTASKKTVSNVASNVSNRVKNLINENGNKKTSDIKYGSVAGSIVISLLFTTALNIAKYYEEHIRKHYKPMKKEDAVPTKEPINPNTYKLTEDEEAILSNWKQVAPDRYEDEFGVEHPLENGYSMRDAFIARKEIMESCNNVNPNYYNGDRYQINCPSCTVAYELNRRGIECEAGDTEGTTLQKILENQYDGEEVYNLRSGGKVREGTYLPERTGVNINKNSFNALEEFLSDMPDGARGAISVTWPYGGGHIFNWEVRHGEVYYVDSQANAVFTYDTETGGNTGIFDNYYISPMTEPVNVWRTDNIDIGDGGYELVAKK